MHGKFHDELQEIAEAATYLADKLPYSIMVLLAASVRQYGAKEWPQRRQGILQTLPTPAFRDATADFLDHWHLRSASVGYEAVAAAVLTAAKGEVAHRTEEVVEIVWTGPQPMGTHFRQTEQAILEVINAAKKRLTIVSYAVYRIPRIGDALIAAASRGVTIRLIVETPHLIEGQSEYNCVHALGPEVKAASSVYYWPQYNRPKDDKGKCGSLHVKCAVADKHQLFLSSANLTEYAFTLNMELGLLVTGGKLPAQIERHFAQLIEVGQLVAV
jgi:phosphatidylserine/phosphatidylglycerophosphate/cardiolipin synthase-like enzyme